MKRIICMLMLYAAGRCFAAPVNLPSEPTEQASACEEALFATGPQWNSAHFFPIKAAHPAFSTTAKNIYFYYDIPGLEIFLQQGPYGGSHFRANTIEVLYINYNPNYFSPLSHFHLMFGNEPINVTLKDGDFSKYYDEGTLGRDEIMQIRIPLEANAGPRDLTKSVQLLISRDTGKIFGYGRKSRSPLASFVKDVWLELRQDANTRKYGYGTWYNSNSRMPLPPFFEWAQKRGL